MIDYLEGNIEEIRENYVLLNINGVGFGISISLSTYEDIKERGDYTKLYTYLNLRENNIELYGFSTKEEREIFKLLISISGVGAKAALSVLSNIPVDKFKIAIAKENYKVFTKIPGLGVKKAKRIIVELKDKFKEFIEESEEIEDMEKIADEYILVLTKLGFSYTKAKEAIRQVYKKYNSVKDKEFIIKEALKLLGG